MVLVVLLTVLDLITALMLISHVMFGLFAPETVLYNAAYLIAKGLLFAKSDFASAVDIFAGVYMALLGFGIFSNLYLSIAVALWLAQKTIFLVLGLLGKTFF